MYDYKKMFVVSSVFVAIIFAFVQMYMLSSQVAEYHSYQENSIAKTAEMLEVV